MHRRCFDSGSARVADYISRSYQIVFGILMGRQLISSQWALARVPILEIIILSYSLGNDASSRLLPSAYHVSEHSMCYICCPRQDLYSPSQHTNLRRGYSTIMSAIQTYSSHQWNLTRSSHSIGDGKNLLD